MRSGLGSFVRRGGKAACGEWADGKMSGFGMQWNRLGQLTECGRWFNDRLVQSCAVPRSQIPLAKFLSPAGQPFPQRRQRSARAWLWMGADGSRELLVSRSMLMVALAVVSIVPLVFSPCAQRETPRCSTPTVASTAAS